MKTKTIPFDLETAKKIQAGEIEGRIMTRGGFNVRIVCWDRKCAENHPIVALAYKDEQEYTLYYTETGSSYSQGYLPYEDDLILQVPDPDAEKCEFKPFQCVLVRQIGNIWQPRLFDSYVDGEYWAQDGESYDYCIPYKDNDYLIGTDKEPNEQ